MKKTFGLSRVRDKKGDIIKRDVKPYVNCIHTLAGAGYETMQILLLEYEKDKRRLLVQGAIPPIRGGCYLSQSESFTHGTIEDVSRTLRYGNNDAGVCVKTEKDMAKIYRIRKLTPTECMRLMGVYDQDTRKMREAGISDSQLYKLAGNSIVVDVLEGIFTQMFRVDSDVIF